MTMERYVFAVGIMRNRKVTVRAASLEEADSRAREALDLRAERGGEEAPVRWDLALISGPGLSNSKKVVGQ